MSPCPCEPVVIHSLKYEDVSYSGMECRLCGARNISNNARPGEIDRVLVDALVGWMMRREELGVDPDTGDMVAFRLAPPVVERGGLRLAAMNS